MMHGNLALFDEALALCGSANFDSRSLFLDYELMVAFHQGDELRRFAVWYEQERVGAGPYVASPPGLLGDAAEGCSQLLELQL